MILKSWIPWIIILILDNKYRNKITPKSLSVFQIINIKYSKYINKTLCHIYAYFFKFFMEVFIQQFFTDIKNKLV